MSSVAEILETTNKVIFEKTKSSLVDYYVSGIKAFNEKSVKKLSTKFNEFNFFIAKNEISKTPITKTLTARFPVKLIMNENTLNNIKKAEDIKNVKFSFKVPAGKKIWRLSVVGSKAIKLDDNKYILEFLQYNSDFDFNKLSDKEKKRLLNSYIVVKPTPKEFNIENIFS